MMGDTGLIGKHQADILSSLGKGMGKNVPVLQNAGAYNTPQKALKAAQDVSGHFIEILMNNALGHTESGSIWGEGQGADMARSMFVSSVSKQMATTGDGMGITSQIYKDIARKYQLGSDSPFHNKQQGVQVYG